MDKEPNENPAIRPVQMATARTGDTLETFNKGVGGSGSVWNSWLSVIVAFVVLAMLLNAALALVFGAKLWNLISLLIGVGVIVISFVIARLYKRHKQRRAREMASLSGNPDTK